MVWNTRLNQNIGSIGICIHHSFSFRYLSMYIIHEPTDYWAKIKRHFFFRLRNRVVIFRLAFATNQSALKMLSWQLTVQVCNLRFGIWKKKIKKIACYIWLQLWMHMNLLLLFLFLSNYLGTTFILRDSRKLNERKIETRCFLILTDSCVCRIIF
jgi:hypothetical protein